MFKRLILLLVVLVQIGVISILYFNKYISSVFHTKNQETIFIDNNQIYCQGIVKSDNTYNISSDIQTKIKSILVKNNDYVTTNQIIIELDNLDFKYQLKLEKNKLDYHNKLLEYQKNKLETYSFLRKNNGISKLDLKDEELELENINFNIKNIKDNIEYLNTKIEQTYIKSPCNGYITEILCQVGEFASSTLLKIDTINNKYVIGYVDEFYALNIKNNRVAIKADGSYQYCFGTIDWSSPIMKEKTLFRNKRNEKNDTLIREIYIKLDENYDFLIKNLPVDIIIYD